MNKKMRNKNYYLIEPISYKGKKWFIENVEKGYEPLIPVERKHLTGLLNLAKIEGLKLKKDYKISERKQMNYYLREEEVIGEYKTKKEALADKANNEVWYPENNFRIVDEKGKEVK